MSKSIETVTVANVIYGIDGDGYSYDAVDKVMTVDGDVQCSDGDEGTLSMQEISGTLATHKHHIITEEGESSVKILDGNAYIEANKLDITLSDPVTGVGGEVEITSSNLPNLANALITPDDEPTIDSPHLITSTGVAEALQIISTNVIPYPISSAHGLGRVYTVILTNNTDSDVLVSDCVTRDSSIGAVNMLWNTDTTSITVGTTEQIAFRFVRLENTVYLMYDGKFDY